MRSALYALAESLPDEVLVWLGSILGFAIALGIGVYVVLHCARLLYALRAGEAMLLIALVSVGGVGSLMFGVRDTLWWMTIPAAGVAGCILLVVVAVLTLESARPWVAALGAAVSVLLVHVVAHLLFSWSDQGAYAGAAGRAALIAAGTTVAAVSALSGTLSFLVERRNLLTVLIAAVASAALLPRLLAFSEFAQVVEARVAMGIVAAGYLLGFFSGASENETALVR